MAVMPLDGVPASFSGFVALPQPFGDTNQMLSLGVLPRTGMLGERGPAPPNARGSPAQPIPAAVLSASAPTEALLMTACPSTIAPCHFT